MGMGLFDILLILVKAMITKSSKSIFSKPSHIKEDYKKMAQVSVPGLVPQKDGSFAIFVEVPKGACPSADDLMVLSNMMKDLNCKVHLTTAQKIMIFDLNEESGKKALEMLSNTGLYAKTALDLSQPRVCIGKPYCKLALQETFPLSETLMEKLAREPIARKIKVGIAGCPACCSWANIIDIGFIGVKSGFQVFIGGHGGARPAIGEKMGMITTHDEAVDLVRKIAKLFRENVTKKSRLERVIKKIGLEEFKSAVGL